MADRLRRRYVSLANSHALALRETILEYRRRLNGTEPGRGEYAPTFSEISTGLRALGDAVRQLGGRGSLEPPATRIETDTEPAHSRLKLLRPTDKLTGRSQRA